MPERVLVADVLDATNEEGYSRVWTGASEQTPKGVAVIVVTEQMRKAGAQLLTSVLGPDYTPEWLDGESLVESIFKIMQVQIDDRHDRELLIAVGALLHQAAMAGRAYNQEAAKVCERYLGN